MYVWKKELGGGGRVIRGNGLNCYGCLSVELFMAAAEDGSISYVQDQGLQGNTIAP